MTEVITASHVAQRKIYQDQQEEEEMTRYTDDELTEDFEFKIVRSNTGAFKKRENVERAIAEESVAGWKFVEKFDNNRMRFKRPASARRNDFGLPAGVDPYRTTYGMGEGGLAVAILVGTAVFVGLTLLVVFLIVGS